MPANPMTIESALQSLAAAKGLDMRNKYPVTLKHLMESKLAESEEGRLLFYVCFPSFSITSVTI